MLSPSAFAQTTPPFRPAPGSGVPPGFETGQAQLGLPNSLILVLQSERLFAESAFGRRVAEDIQARSAVLTAENRKIEAELRAEEQSLTQRRQFTEPNAFRTLADAFDEKVQATRVAQENKFREISKADEDARVEFRRISVPILQQIMRDVGAAVILEKSTVLLSAETIDITDLAISRIDAILDEDRDLGRGSGEGE